MGIYETLMRSQGNIDQLANVVQGYFKRKHDDEVRQRVKEMFTQYAGGTQTPTDAGVQPATEVPSVGQSTQEPGMRPIRGKPEIATAPAPISFADPITRQAAASNATPITRRTRGIESAEDIYNLADLTRQDPTKMVEAATAEEAKNVPKTHFGTRGEVYQVDRKGNIRKIQGPEYPPARETATKEPKASLLRSEIVNVNGVKKQVDYYGYKDSQGERVTEKKYSDFTPRNKTPKEFKRSGTLKTLDAKKQALEKELKRSYPEVDLDSTIVNGLDPDDPSPAAGMLRKYLSAIDDYESRADTEGEGYNSAFSVAQRNLSQRQSQAPIATSTPGEPATPAAPAAGPRSATISKYQSGNVPMKQGKYSQTAINKKTGERVGLNAQGKWEKIPASQ